MSARFMRFVVVGAVGFVVDASITLGLAHLGVFAIVARAPALMAAMTTTWLLNRRLTFRVARPGNGPEFVRYCAVAAGSAFANFAVYGGLVLAGLPPLVAIALATGLLMMLSYVAYREFAFR